MTGLEMRSREGPTPRYSPRRPISRVIFTNASTTPSNSGLDVLLSAAVLLLPAPLPAEVPVDVSRCTVMRVLTTQNGVVRKTLTTPAAEATRMLVAGERLVTARPRSADDRRSASA